MTAVLASQDFKNKAHFLSYLTEAYARANPPSLHCYAILLNDEFNLEEAFERARRKGLHVTLTRRSNDLYLLGIGVRTSYQVGFLVPTDGVLLFFSDTETGKLTSTVSAFVRNMFPILKLVYLPSRSMLQVLDGTRKKYDRFLVTEGTIWTKDQTFRNWKKEPQEFSVQSMARLSKRDEGKWTGISFKAMADEKEVFSCRIYEKGHLTLYAGRFPEFFSDVVLPYLGAALRVHKMFHGKELKERHGKVELSPIRVDFADQITRGEMELLTAKLVNRYLAAVTHPGNPMLVVQLSDRDDGSSYDLYAYDNKVEIVPLQKATAGSLAELVAVVSDVLPTGTPAVV